MGLHRPPLFARPCGTYLGAASLLGFSSLLSRLVYTFEYAQKGHSSALAAGIFSHTFRLAAKRRALLSVKISVEHCRWPRRPASGVSHSPSTRVKSVMVGPCCSSCTNARPSYISSSPPPDPCRCRDGAAAGITDTTTHTSRRDVLCSARCCKFCCKLLWAGRRTQCGAATGSVTPQGQCQPNENHNLDLHAFIRALLKWLRGHGRSPPH